MDFFDSIITLFLFVVFAVAFFVVLYYIIKSAVLNAIKQASSSGLFSYKLPTQAPTIPPVRCSKCGANGPLNSYGLCKACEQKSILK